ncbi:CaiB/BaiF CoA transferase family protein [Amycolatopsis pithecellobii]|uniref:CoA transferase n=1 Tax=Amycolatopsis pithecellobii TaxID=664692 RepID=A0A6N7Z1V0_9PSEU|nr:CaiB/BaiF CoA-transferase family protein [Amycolatopsis pithecellobii]MTD55453.1 CoA transferase [Amycolatopsis pithecellobii]
MDEVATVHSGEPGAARSAGPLTGIRVLEFAGMGPAPFAAMMLADLGAEVIRLDRLSQLGRPARDLVVRGRRSVAVDLKHPEGRDVALALTARSDVLIEGYRPGVMERLGLSPKTCLAVNPQLVYGRMTGWGQTGPYAQRAGHDINYIAMSGALAMIGRRDQPPTPPLNLLGDLGGGGCFLAFGVLCALLARNRSGKGQVVDAAMVDGSALLTTMFHGAPWTVGRGPRGTNMLDSGAPFYDVYETEDHQWISVGAIEAAFYAELVDGLGLDHTDMYPQLDRAGWPRRKELVAGRFRSKTLSEWLTIFGDRDACVAPVLDPLEASRHEHHVERNSYVDIAGVRQPAPVPRFSESEPAVPEAAPRVGAHSVATLRELGHTSSAIDRLIARGVFGQATGSTV